jgi:hypothetical protein
LVLDSNQVVPSNQPPEVWHSIQGIRAFQGVFQANPEQINTYVHNVLALAKHTTPTEPQPTAKNLQKLTSKVLQSGETPSPELQEQLATVTMLGEKVEGSVLDLYKIERFALQQMFIGRQMKG